MATVPPYIPIPTETHTHRHTQTHTHNVTKRETKREDKERDKEREIKIKKTHDLKNVKKNNCTDRERVRVRSGSERRGKLYRLPSQIFHYY